MMANTIMTNDILAKYVAAYFRNFNKAIHLAYQPFDTDFDRDINGYNIGAELRFRLPNYVNVRTGIVAQPQNLVERFETIVLDRPIGSDWNPNMFELTTSMASEDMVVDRFVMPSVLQMANTVDKSITDALDTSVYNVVDNSGSGVNSFGVFNSASKYMDKLSIIGNKKALFNVDDMATLQNSMVNFFNSTFNEEIGIEGRLGMAADVECFQDQNIGTHTNGTFPGSPVIAANAVNGATTLSLSGFTAAQTGVLKRGDIIRVAGVFKVNKLSRQAIGAGTANLATFIVQADVDSDGGGLATVSISPTITFSVDNPYNNVSALPAAGATVTLVGGASTTYTNNYLLVRDGILLAIKPYIRPSGLTPGAMGSYTDQDTGLSCSVIDWYNGINHTNLKRIDLLYGFKIQPEYIVRLIG